jgi:YesN/AraC family two-component response regulator
MIYPELKNNLGYFLKLFRLSRKEGLTPENIIGFLNMAANLQKLNEKFHFHLNEVKDLELKKSQCREQLEILRNNKRSTKEQLSDTESCKQKFGELSEICFQVRMLEYQIEPLKNNQSYQAIEQAAKEKVNDYLTDNGKSWNTLLSH